MPVNKTVTLYTYSELSETAKEAARGWYREAGSCDDWWGDVYEDAARVASLLGITLDRKDKGRSPTIWFSGFSSQGDGACFEGSYRYAKGSVPAVKAYAPTDAELHRIAEGLLSLQKGWFYQLTARCIHRGHYYHSGCMAVDVWHLDPGFDGREGFAYAEEVLTDLMRDFADWIHTQLEAEYDHRDSDTTVGENIALNGYLFHANGRIEG